MKINYYLRLVYVAPENAVDEKGNPIQIFNRSIGLDKSAYKKVVEQMKNGVSNVTFEGKIKMSDGHIENKATFVQLNNTSLIFAETGMVEEPSKEEAEKAKKEGATVILDPSGQPMILRN